MWHGVINIYKEKGFTSHDVVAKLRGILGQKKIGHTGTLDPDAEGVLPVCLGKGTKLCDLLTEKDKTYEAVLLLGKTTDTLDISGQVLEEKDTEGITEEAVEKAVYSFQESYEQIPPMYSALKIGGKKLYELAREGITVERKARTVVIHEITVLGMELPRIRFRVTCSKGTYIRSLCQDIGEKLGCGGCMESLLRTRVERFDIKESHTLSEVEAARDAGRLKEYIIPVDRMFDRYPAYMVLPEFEKAAFNGNSLPLHAAVILPHVEKETVQESAADKRIRLYDRQERFIGLYQPDEKNRQLRLIRMFRDPDE